MGDCDKYISIMARVLKIRRASSVGIVRLTCLTLNMLRLYPMTYEDLLHEATTSRLTQVSHD